MTSKTLDTIDREKLYYELYQTSNRGTALECFKSYLKNISQVVSIDNDCIDALSGDNFVVQGTLEPLFFFSYNNNVDFFKY